MKDKTIGWIGTGIMGAPMAMHLVNAGYKVVVNNRTRSKAEELVNKGCTWYDSPAELAANAEIIFTIIGFPKDVEEVYFGKNGIFRGPKEGSILVDMTTTLPSLAMRIYDTAVSKGCSSVDAPVSGGQVGAVNGTLSVMAGGDRKVFDSLMPLIECFGKNIVYQGKAGSGQHTKVCNQITIAGTMIGVCESMLYGYRAGLDLNAVLASISKGAAGCWSLDVLAPKIVRGDFAPGFIIEHFIKDMGIALREAEAMNLALPGLALVRQLYLSLQSQSGGKLGTQALYLALKNLSKVE